MRLTLYKLKMMNNVSFFKIILSIVFCLLKHYAFAASINYSQTHNRIDSLNQIAYQYFLKGNNKGMNLANQALIESETSDYLYGATKSRNNLALYLNVETKYKESLYQLFTSVNLLQTLLKTTRITDDQNETYNEALYSTFLLVCDVYRNLDRPDLQLKYSQLAEVYLFKTNYSQQQLMQVKLVRASVYSQLDMLDKALFVYNEVKEYFQKKKDIQSVLGINRRMAKIYITKGELKKAKLLLNASLPIEQQSNQNNVRNEVLLLKAEIANKQGKFIKALSYCTAVEKDENYTNNLRQCIHLEKGRAFYGMNDLNRAELFLFEALLIFVDKNKKNYVMETAKILKNIYKTNNNPIKISEVNTILNHFEKELLDAKIDLTLDSLPNENVFVSDDSGYVDSLIKYDNRIRVLYSIFGVLLSIMIVIWTTNKINLTN